MLLESNLFHTYPLKESLRKQQIKQNLKKKRDANEIQKDLLFHNGISINKF